MPPIVTCFSCIASSSAACTLAGARLISSARTMLAKIGPFLTDELPGRLVVDLRADDVGRQQVGRELDALRSSCEIVSASVRTVSVFARPGTPSSSTWPPVSRLMSSRSIMYSCPTTRRATWRADVLDEAGIGARRDLCGHLGRGRESGSSECRPLPPRDHVHQRAASSAHRSGYDASRSAFTSRAR